MSHTMIILGVPTLAASLTLIDVFSPLLAHIALGALGLIIGITGAALLSKNRPI